MAFNNDNAARLNMLCLRCSDHLLIVINWLVERLSLEQRINAFVHQSPIDSIGGIEIVVSVGVSDVLLLFVLCLILLFDDRISPRSPPEVASDGFVEVDQIQDASLRQTIFDELGH